MPTAQMHVRDRSVIAGLAAASLAAVVAIGLIFAFAPRSVAPRINVRWADSADENTRLRLEHDFHLFAAEHREGTTWAYDLGDPSPEGIRKIVDDPRVADTHQIDRSRYRVSADAPFGRTRIRGGLSAWRDAPALSALFRFSISCLAISSLWLLTDRSAHSGAGRTAT
jgi:hypothetical protein